MTCDELATEIVKLRPVVKQIMDLHDLSEEILHPITPLEQVTYDAQIYAKGVELAHRLFHIIHWIKTSDYNGPPDP